MHEQRHILVFPVSLWNGMAGTRRVRTLLDELAETGYYTFSNLTISDPGEWRGRAETGGEQGIPFCRIGYRYYNPLTWLGFWYAGFRFIDRMRRGHRHNFVYCYQETDPATLPLLLLARWLGYKVVVDIVEDNAYLNKPFRNGLVRARVRSGVWLLNHLPAYADAAIAISSYLFEKTKRIANGRISVTLIPISVNLNAFGHRASTSEPGLGNRPFRVFYGGSFGAKDGIQYLLEAVARCLPVYPQLKLVLTGVGSVTDMAQFRRMVNGLDIDRAVDYRGYLSDDAYRRTLQSCDACCMTRTNSAFANAGFPFKLGEMLATGKPVVATKVGDIPTYLTDGESALLIDPEKSEQLADRLIWLIQHYPQGLVIGAAGRQVAEQHFDARRVAGRLARVFDELVRTPQPHSHEPYAEHFNRL